MEELRKDDSMTMDEAEDRLADLGQDLLAHVRRGDFVGLFRAGDTLKYIAFAIPDPCEFDSFEVAGKSIAYAIFNARRDAVGAAADV